MTTTHVAFLRAVNVGGRTIRKEQLIDLFTAFGAEDVWTFLASGNVGFSHPGGSSLGRDLEAHLEATLGIEVPVVVRTAAALRGLAAADPFGGAPGTRYVALSSTPLDAEVATRLDAVGSASDRFHIDGCDLWWSIDGRYSDSPFGGPRLERTVGGVLTVRKHATLGRLAKKLGQAG